MIHPQILVKQPVLLVKEDSSMPVLKFAYPTTLGPAVNSAQR
jgi:hypothetical protein